MQRLTGRLVLLTVLAVGAGSSGPRASQVPAAGGNASAESGKKLQGVASCSASACHGMNGPRGALGCEYTTWINFDPHARAFEALYNRQSQQIEKNLRKLASLKEAKPE